MDVNGLTEYKRLRQLNIEIEMEETQWKNRFLMKIVMKIPVWNSPFPPRIF